MSLNTVINVGKRVLFSPSDIQGLIYQADFIDSNNYTLADTDKLESVSDQSAAANADTLKLTDAERPTYKASGRAGTPCIEFGGSQIIKMPDIMTGEFTKIIFGNYYNQPNVSNARIIWGGDSSGDHSLGFNNTLGDNWPYGNVFTNTKYDLMSPANNKSIFCAMTETRSSTEGGLYAGEIEYDRDSQVANTDNSSYIGGRFSGNNDITGEVYGWVLYNRELSESEVREVVEWGYKRFYKKTHSIKMIAAGQSNLRGAQETGTPVTPVSGDGYEYNHASGFIRELIEKVGKERAILGDSREPNLLQTTIFPKLARELTINQSKDLLLMNTARGGSSVAFGTIHWGATGSTDPIRQQAIDGLERFKKHIGTPDILLWDQGLSDQSRLESSTINEAQFKSATEDVFSAFRTVFPNLKIGLILNNPWIDEIDGTTEEFPNGRAKVNSAFNDIATEQANTFIVADASTFTIANGNLEAGDGVHWTVQGGDDIASQIENWIGINL